MINLGEKIRQDRKETGLTQKELAEMLEVHWNTVARWERNEIECRIDQLHRIAAITKRHISWFFSEDPATKGKAFVQVDGLKFRFAREKNNYTVKDIAVLLELPEKVIKDIEKESAKLEMEYLHRMVFVLGYPVSWFFTDDSNKEWIENKKVYERWLDTGREDWKFKEQYYSMWEQGKMKPRLGFDDMENHLKNSYEMWLHFFNKKESEFSDEDKKTLEYLKSLTQKLSDGVKSEIDYFLKLKKARERQKLKEDKNIKEIAKLRKALEER